MTEEPVAKKIEIQKSDFVVPDYPEFDPKEDLKDFKNFSIAIYAKRRSGKSVLLRYVLSKIHKWYETAYLFCETIEFQKDMFNYVPEENRFSTFNEQKLEEIYNTQKRRILRLCEERGEKNKKDFPHILILMDDFINDQCVRTCKIFKDLATLGRHSNIAFISLAQCVGGRDSIPKAVRGNLDVVIAFLIESEYDRKLIIEQFLSLHSKKEGYEIMEKITSKQHQALVILNGKKSSDYNDIIRVCNADLNVKKFMIGTEKPTEHKGINKNVYGSLGKKFQYYPVEIKEEEEKFGKSVKKKY